MKTSVGRGKHLIFKLNPFKFIYRSKLIAGWWYIAYVVSGFSETQHVNFKWLFSLGKHMGRIFKMTLNVKLYFQM